MDDINYNRYKILISIGTRTVCHEMLEVINHDDYDTMVKLYHKHLVEHIKNEKLNNKIKKHIESFVSEWNKENVYYRSMWNIRRLDHSIKKTYQSDMDIVISIGEYIMNEDEVDNNNESIKNMWNDKYGPDGTILLEYNGKRYTKKEIIDMIEKVNNNEK